MKTEKECCYNCKYTRREPVKKKLLGWHSYCSSSASPYNGTLTNDLLWCSEFESQLKKGDRDESKV